jgi:hypothetical protein
MKIFIRHNLRIWTLADSRISQIPDSGVSQVHDSRSSQVPGSRVSQILDSRVSRVSIILKWTADSRKEVRFGYRFRMLLENLKNT